MYFFCAFLKINSLQFFLTLMLNNYVIAIDEFLADMFNQYFIKLELCYNLQSLLQIQLSINLLL